MFEADLLFRFAEPQALWLLLALPLWALWQGHRRRPAAVRFSSLALLGAQATRPRRGFAAAGLPFVLLPISCFILALARPQTGEESVRIETSGVDIVLAVDLSTSMWAHDFEADGQRQDRLSVVQRVVADFIERRPNDRIALLAFAQYPYLVSPLTLNHGWLQERLSGLHIGQIEDGTAIGSAITAGLNRLRDLEAESRILILLTDGANNAGPIEPLAAAKAALPFGVTIHTVGVGQSGRVPYPVDLDARGRPVTDQRGQPILRLTPSNIDLESLAAVSELTGGQSFHATDTAELERIYAAIDALETTEVEQQFNRIYADVFTWPLAAGLALLLLGWLHQLLRRPIP